MNNAKDEENEEYRYDLLAMLDEIKSENKLSEKKIAKQSEISALFKNKRTQRKSEKDD